MTSKAARETTVSAALIDRWEKAGRKLTALAKEVPENTFDYRPVDGARTFADVLRHVAFWNRYVADSARGRKADDATNELPKHEFSSKTQIVQALSSSAADAGDALKENLSDLDAERAEMVISFLDIPANTTANSSCTRV